MADMNDQMAEWFLIFNGNKNPTKDDIKKLREEYTNEDFVVGDILVNQLRMKFNRKNVDWLKQKLIEKEDKEKEAKNNDANRGTY